MAVKQTKISTRNKKNTIVRKKTGSETKVQSGLKIPTYDYKGDVETESVIPKDLQSIVSSGLIAQAYRVYRNNLRQGTQSTKTRGEVKGSSRKIFRQKGTGRARHGSIRAPIFVGGGITFGPKPRNFESKINKKMRQKALLGLINNKLSEKKLVVVSGLNKLSGKTKEAASLFGKIIVNNSPFILLIEPKMENTIRAVRNIPNITIRNIDNISIYDLIKYNYLIMSKESLEKFITKTFKKNETNN